MKTSILLITYNHEKYIRKAVESILMQQYDCDSEIIVADDHSTDNTVAIIKDLFAETGNVSIFSNEKNLGITKNYERAFARCKGEYIFVLEGDDYWTDPLKIKKQVDFLEQYRFCVVCSHPFYSLRQEMNLLLPPPGAYTEYDFFDGKDLILNSSIVSNFSTCCYRSAALKKISPETYNVISYEWMVNISVSQFGMIGRINEPMSVYRISSTGAWSKISEREQIEGTIKILPEYDRILDHTWHEYFEIKKQHLTDQLVQMDTKPISVKNFISTKIIPITKLFIPPVMISFARKIKKKFFL